MTGSCSPYKHLMNISLLCARCWGSGSRVMPWVKSPSLILLRLRFSAKSNGEKVAEYFECCALGWKTVLQNQVLGGLCHQSSPCGRYTPRRGHPPAALCCSWRWEEGSGLRDSCVHCCKCNLITKMLSHWKLYIFFLKKGIVL